MANVVIVDQACDFGAKTLINAGAYQLVNTGGDVLSIGAVTGTASTQYTAAVVSGQVVLTAKVANPTAGTVIIADVTGIDTVNIGSVTVTVSVIANSYSVSSMTEMDAAGSLAALAFGDTIYFRDGEYNPSRTYTDVIKRSVPLTGTWNGSNYVEFKPHDGATAVNLWRIEVDGNTVKNSYFHFTKSDDGLSTLNCKAIGDGVMASFLGILQFANGASYAKISECTFVSAAGTLPSTALDLNAGIVFTGAGGNGNNIVDNNTFQNLYDGISHTGVTTNLSITNNTITEIWNDCMKFAWGNNVTITGNLMYDKKYGDGALHGDYIQGLFAGATADITGLTITGNIAYRGDGTSGQPDGQFVFLRGNTGFNVDGFDISNNFCLIEFTRGISIQNPINGTADNNTILTDNPDTTAITAIITDDESSVPSSQGNNTLSNNVTNLVIDGFAAVGDVLTNNVLVAKSEAAYSAAFFDPKYNTDVTDPATHYAPLSGGPLDVSPAVGPFPIIVVDTNQSISSLWISYLVGQGYSGGSINEIKLVAFTDKSGLTNSPNLSAATMRYFDLQSVPTGSINDRYGMFLDANYPSLTGSVNDRLVQTLKNNQFFL